LLCIRHEILGHASFAVVRLLPCACFNHISCKAMSSLTHGHSNTISHKDEQYHQKILKLLPLP
jgi:hypothetical protein